MKFSNQRKTLFITYRTTNGKNHSQIIKIVSVSWRWTQKRKKKKKNKKKTCYTYIRKQSSHDKYSSVQHSSWSQSSAHSRADPAPLRSATGTSSNTRSVTYSCNPAVCMVTKLHAQATLHHPTSQTCSQSVTQAARGRAWASTARTVLHRLATPCCPRRHPGRA